MKNAYSIILSSGSNDNKFISYRNRISKHMIKLFPLGLFYAMVEIIEKLFLYQSSFFAMVLAYNPGKYSVINTLIEFLYIFKSTLLIMLMSIFLLNIVRDLSEERGIQSFWPSIGAFVFSILIFEDGIFNLEQDLAVQPIWLFLIIIGIAFASIASFFHKGKGKSVFLKWFLAALTVSFVLLIVNSQGWYNIMTLFSTFLEIINRWFGDGPNHIYSVVAWSVVAPIALVLGLPILESLAVPVDNSSFVAQNLAEFISKSGVKYPFTLYTIHDAFALFGGIGIMIGFFFALYIAKKERGETITRYTKLALFPLLFDQPLPFLLAFPVFMQPLLLIPMVISTIVAELIGVLLIYLNILPPAIYNVPLGTPSLLFGYFASGNHLGYLLIAMIIIVISVLIYMPFVRRLLDKGGAE